MGGLRFAQQPNVGFNPISNDQKTTSCESLLEHGCQQKTIKMALF